MTERYRQTRGVIYQDADEDVAKEMQNRSELEKKLVVDPAHQHVKQQRKLRTETIIQTLLGTPDKIEPHTDVDGEECVCDQPELHGDENNHRDEFGRECMCDAPEEHEW